MKSIKKNSWQRLVSRIGVTLASAMMTTVVLAGTNSTSLSNGAQLSVSIDDPVSTTEFKVPAADPDGKIDVPVHGKAGIGLGDPDNTFIYVIDESGSTAFSGSGGTGCSIALICEKNFFNGLNAAVIADGSTDLAGVVYYESTSRIAQFPTSPVGITSAINSGSAGGGTNCAAGLASALALINSVANTNTHNAVVFASDGQCNTGANVSGVVASIAATGAVLNSIAIGTSSSCASNGGTGTLNSITANGGTCIHVPNPGNLPNIISNLTGSSLDSLDIEINSGGKNQISNVDISPDLPIDAMAEVGYWTDAKDLIPGNYKICVTANGSDVLGDMADVSQCETISLLKLTAGPDTKKNDLNTDTSHTITTKIIGGSGPARDIGLVVGGTNASSATFVNNPISATPNVSVGFTYSVPQVCTSLGTDTITVSTVIAGMADSIVLEKKWVDESPPNVSCKQTVNPHGKNVPKAPGNGGKGQNQDGFYEIITDDGVLDCEVMLVVTDGDGFVFPGPFSSGDKIKYTQADGAAQTQKKMGSKKGSAGAIRWHLKGHGDLTVTATDTSGNSSSVSCLVPPKPQ